MAELTQEMVTTCLEHLPETLFKAMQRIPVPEQASVLVDSGVDPEDIVKGMDEEAYTAMEKAIRYKDARVQLVRMMLIARIRDDVEDPDDAADMAAHILALHTVDSVFAVYEKDFCGKPFPPIAAA